MDDVLEFVSPIHSEIERLDGPQEYYTSKNTNAWHKLDYQLIDKDQNATTEGQLKGTYIFLSCGCIG